jgi:hypothetical protein
MACPISWAATVTIPLTGGLATAPHQVPGYPFDGKLAPPKVRSALLATITISSSGARAGWVAEWTTRSTTNEMHAVGTSCQSCMPWVVSEMTRLSSWAVTPGFTQKTTLMGLAVMAGLMMLLAETS